MTISKMPVLFIGHGSPMNAIDENNFTKSLNRLGQQIEKPKAILAVSAHWLTRGSFVTAMDKPKTIHDFGGFPRELHEVQYPAPGSPELARELHANLPVITPEPDDWGLDHGTWSVLRHMYPQADVPVLQLSIDYPQTGEHHVKLGEELRFLREKGVLIVASGNIVHNLRTIDWNPDAPAFEWAIEFDEWTKNKILARDHKPLMNDFAASEMARLSVPTPDHYFPLLYTLGASDSKDEISFPFEGMQNASISMRAVAFGLK